MSNSTFDPLDHPRDPIGRFDAKPGRGLNGELGAEPADGERRQTTATYATETVVQAFTLDTLRQASGTLNRAASQAVRVAQEVRDAVESGERPGRYWNAQAFSDLAAAQASYETALGLAKAAVRDLNDGAAMVSDAARGEGRFVPPVTPE